MHINVFVYIKFEDEQEIHSPGPWEDSGQDVAEVPAKALQPEKGEVNAREKGAGRGRAHLHQQEGPWRWPTGAVFSLLWTQPGRGVRGREHSRWRKTKGDLASRGEIQLAFPFSSALTSKSVFHETGDFRQQILWKHMVGFRCISVE